MSAQRFKLLYDGKCPFCRREVNWLRRRDRHGAIEFEDIFGPGFDPGRYGLTQEQVNGHLHGILPEGRVVSRVDAIREAYRAVGLGWLVWPIRLPVVRWLLDFLYEHFSRNRYRLADLWNKAVAAGKGSQKPVS
jgi:predicted DCC family thiol-disulfide oxidoreductase YuxK